ncbi:MAG: type I restriction endonuclease subunit R [Candidatus Delongbacteria bacterium]
MTPSGYTEDTLVEKPAIALLSALGWETVNAYHEFDRGASTLGRETKADVILNSRLRPALERLNPGMAPETITQAMAELSRDRSRMSLVAANQALYHLMKEGVRVPVPDVDGDGETIELVRVLDWNKPEQNDFMLCSQLWVSGEMHTRRADLVGFVNGLPLLFIELKATHRRLETAFTGNLRDYKDTIPHLFWPNALIILSNGSQSRVGSVTAGWEHLAEWKKISSEEEAGRVSLETMLRGVCEPARFLDLVENFTLFQDVPGGQIKLTAKNHQYLGVNNALDALSEIKERQGRLGVFWHTQGSGKSVSMIFFAQKVLRKVPGNWTFVIVTDRQELDGQIYKNFASAGVVTEGQAQATSGKHLQQLLREDHRYIFTLIHKFRDTELITNRSDIIVITDEAHRSQYDTLALNMRSAMPNAAFLAFTGTPLIVGEEKTKTVFGDYISIYDFKQSVEDGSTVRLFYENRIPELQLVNKDLNEDMERLLEEAELDEGQEKRLEHEFAREYHLITRDDRLEAIAKDLVTHFLGRGFQGKAMMICIDKATAIRMYDKVKIHWDKRVKAVQSAYDSADDNRKKALEKDLNWLKETDMAVVVSQGQNEIADMADKGLDIKPHRRRMIEEDLESRFKNAKDPFRLVFVCAMWMTGFDVPSCSTIYLDKPMRNHTLMQTIARANRVYPGKVSGLIVDYVGVFAKLEKALSIYGKGLEGKKPVEDKSALVVALQRSVTDTKALCAEQGISLEVIDRAKEFDRIRLLDDAVDALVGSEEIKKRFLDLVNTVHRLYKAMLPDTQACQFEGVVSTLRVIAEKIRALTPLANISVVMQQVEDLLDRSIATEGYLIRESQGEYGDDLVDLSHIDFKALAEKFKPGRKRTINEKLKGAVASKLSAMVRVNKTRMDYLEKFQAMIDAYNAGTLNAEEFFKRLMEFAQNLNEEEKRGVGEQLTEEELALFDLLTKPKIELNPADRERVKATARALLSTLKESKLVLDWRKRQQSRAEVRVTIEKLLDEGLPRVYSPDLFEQKTSAVYQHVYEAYYGAGRSIYDVA